MTGTYYLHTNGDLIFKIIPPEPDSDFVVRVWPIDTDNRATAWTIILEAMVLGCRLERAKRLVEIWKCDKRDLVEFIMRTKPDKVLFQGIKLYLEKIGNCDPEKWLDWLAATPPRQEPDWEEMP
jgi:hypothetical protein